MKYLLIVLIALSGAVTIPAFALDSGEYLIESDQTLILITVSENEAVIDDLFFEGVETQLKFIRISSDGNNGRIFGDVDGKFFYIIFDVEENTFNIKTWDGKDKTKSFQTLDVQSIF